MTSSDLINAVLHKLVEDAAPLVAHAAYGGGSLFYKMWVDTARGIGIEIIDPYSHLTQEGEGTSGELE